VCYFNNRNPDTTELHRETKANVDIPLLHLPKQLPIVAKDELPQILEVAPPETQELDNIRARLATAHHSYDVDTLFHVHQTSLRAERNSFWHLIITTGVCTLAVLLVLYFCNEIEILSFIIILICIEFRYSGKSDCSSSWLAQLTFAVAYMAGLIT